MPKTILSGLKTEAMELIAFRAKEALDATSADSHDLIEGRPAREFYELRNALREILELIEESR